MVKPVENPKLVVEGLSVQYPDGTESLRNVSLQIPRNAITVLFGPAGGGKSTLLRTFNRLNDLVEGTRYSGRVLLDGRNILEPGFDLVALRRRVGMVFAQPVPLPMTVRENMQYGLTLAGEHRRQKLDAVTEEALRAAALWEEMKDRLDDPAAALSGGQQQRLCLARVLALQPEVILMDEPTSGLDPISTAKVEDSLQALKKTYTIVIVPHSVQQAGRLADWAGFFLQGELVEWGFGKNLFIHPKIQKTEDYVTGRFG